MEQKLTLSDIEYAYNLAEHKTDEELATMLKKPVAIVQMLFSLMTGLPKRPWEKFALPEVAPIPAAKEEPVKAGRKPVSLRPLKVGRKKKKVPAKKKATSKKEKPVQVVKKPHSAHAQSMARQKARKSNDRNSIYATRPIDLNGKIRVKLNARTEVWVEPGTDIEKLKKKLNIA